MNNPTAKTAAPYRPPERRTMLRRSANSSPAMPKAKNILEGKTEEEIRAISQKSKLNTTAAAYSFNPNTSRTMARVVLPPSPLSLQHSGPAGEQSSTTMQLDEVWCLFYLPLHGEHIKEETYNPTLVFRIDSVPTFWKVVNNIPIPTKLPYCTLYMFRDGIDPRWEDAANRDGGIVRLKINHNRAKTFNTLSPTQDRVEKASDSNVNEAWELLMCRTIGDSWSPEVRDTVNGIALKIRERSYIIEVWVTKSTPGITSDLSQLLHGTLGSVFAVNYYSHASMQERSHQLEIKAKQQQQQIAQSNKNSKNNKKY
ncbi:translation initiation factor 4E [Angomonas deanei]|nr:translation initiation factor 4E [Angomonas deanei]|eukprot:EPY39787.1 translation initiation factor 4E [Angomonas deanei]